MLYSSMGWGQLASQAIGLAVIWTVIFGVAFSFFKIQNVLAKGGIRSNEEDEVAGLDLPERGVLAYPEFSSSDGYSGDTSTATKVPVS